MAFSSGPLKWKSQVLSLALLFIENGFLKIKLVFLGISNFNNSISSVNSLNSQEVFIVFMPHLLQVLCNEVLSHHFISRMLVLMDSYFDPPKIGGQLVGRKVYFGRIVTICQYLLPPKGSHFEFFVLVF